MQLQSIVWSTFGSNGTVDDILHKNKLDTSRFVYQFDNDSALSPQVSGFNAIMPDLTAALDSQGQQSVQYSGGVPCTLGDLYVPFSMQQIDRQRQRIGEQRLPGAVRNSRAQPLRLHRAGTGQGI